jgi:hypothetical protein
MCQVHTVSLQENPEVVQADPECRTLLEHQEQPDTCGQLQETAEVASFNETNF